MLNRAVVLLFTLCCVAALGAGAAACTGSNPELSQSPSNHAAISDSVGPSWDSTELLEGITWYQALDYDPRFDSNQSYNAIELALDEAEVEVQFLWFYERTALLSMIANQVGAIAAINGTYLEKGTQFFKSRDSVYQTITVFDDHPGYWMKEGAVYSDASGRFGVTYGSNDEFNSMPYPDIVSAGPVLIHEDDPVGLELVERPHATHEDSRHPRTAIAVGDNGRRLVLFTVDGRAEEAEGLTTPELTSLLKEDFAAFGALNLDGGGTTTMWIKGETHTGVVNYPSDNGVFDHYGERWTGQGIMVIPKTEEETPQPSTETCVAEFGSPEDYPDEQEQYIYLGDQVDGLMDMPAGQDFTVSLWTRPRLVGGDTLTLVNKRMRETGNGGTTRGYEVYVTPSGEIVAVLDNGSDKVILDSEASVEGMDWAHVALTFTDAQARLYLNGEIAAEETSAALSDGFDNKLFLTAGSAREWATDNHQGRTSPHSPWSQSQFGFSRNRFVGEMDQVQVWHRGLSANEIAMIAEERLMEVGEAFSLEEEGLISFWRLDDSSGNLARDATGNVNGTFIGNIGRRCIDE